MKSKSCTWLVILFLIFINFSSSSAKEAKPMSDTLTFDYFLNKTHQWMIHHTEHHEIQFKLSVSNVLAGVLCFIAASISSAGGIGGGGLFIPILTIVAGLDLKTASSFSAFMVTGVRLQMSSSTCYPHVLDMWLITVLFAIFLAWSTSKTCKTGVLCWEIESEELRRSDSARDVACEESEENRSAKEPLLVTEENRKLRFPWMKLGILVLVWCSFCFVYLLRGNRDGQGITDIEPCGVGYWILSAFQIPLALVYTAWMLRRKIAFHIKLHTTRRPADSKWTVEQTHLPRNGTISRGSGWCLWNGGGMLISPLLLQVGIAPEVTAATCSFMVFFSSTMSAFQYLLLGMEHIDMATIFATICFVASLLGLVVVHRAIQKYGRASLIVFSVSIVMALSTVLMTSYGAIDVWRNYTSGKYMGFKLPC
ncbi:hypothetical protein FNV43_RR06547 [Rhamnella rubrinervis]|uniref:Sulfite exporter TauE/SafE family protein n=1 Tax=Rhamnella rubrinervis TaxID=2594499 RepID=A0A8K0HER8_9ROSA|nr:hypothetical protein FNV43_RR06547 [Rhamnella rubrinervis]